MLFYETKKDSLLGLFISQHRRRLRHPLFALSLLIFFPFPALNAETFYIAEDIKKNKPLDRKFVYFTDEENIDIKNLIQKDQNGQINWEKINKRGFSFGYVDEPIWLKLNIKNHSMDSKFYISFLYAPADSIELFLPSKNIYKQTGIKVSKNKDSIFSPQPALSFRLNQDESDTVYLRIDTKYTFYSTADLIPDRYFFKYTILNNLPFIIFFAISFFIVIHNLFHFFQKNIFVYLYFSGYVFFNFLYQFFILGFSSLTGFTNPVFYETMMHVSCELTAFFSMFFIRDLMKLKEDFPFLLKIYNKVIWFVFTGFFLYLIGFDSFSRFANSILFIPLALSYYYIFIYNLLWKKRGSFIFIAAWTIGLLGHIIYLLANLSVVPLIPEIFHAAILMFVIEIAGISYLVAKNGSLIFYEEGGSLLIRQKENIFKDENEIQDLRKIYHRLFEEEKPYLEWNFSISDLAGRMQMPVHKMSVFLNSEMNMSFREIINRCRINHAKKLMKNNPEFKIITIMLNSGYQSKSTFNRVFKDLEGISPQDFKDNQIIKNSAENQ